jgi:L-alanine-DL-glutamate epimerase-like enolase superfamily enzyme
MTTAIDRPAPSRAGSRSRHDAPITRITASAYTFPTDAPESDGTFTWDSTTIVVVEVTAANQTGLGYTYASHVAAPLIVDALAQDVVGRDAFDNAAGALAMSARLRNAGRPGIGATAISAVDNALWDLKARLVGVSLLDLLGATRDAVPAYGSGGFTSYSDNQLRDQLGGWAAAGFRMVKMKIGRDPRVDPHRVSTARAAIGGDVALFVDANGAFDPRQAVAAATSWLDEQSVTWFEEPVSSDDVGGLAFVRDHAPAAMAIAAGEYCWAPHDFTRLAEGPAIDVIQADATRCLGVSGFLAAVGTCRGFGIPMSTHCAPSLHATLACAADAVRHIEWFHDHVRLEHIFFDGAAEARDGLVHVDRGRPGLGIDLRTSDVEKYLVWKGEFVH